MGSRELRRRIDQHLATNNQLLERLAVVTMDNSRLITAQTEELKTQGSLLTAQTEQLVSLREETHAQTMALFRMIDRLGPGEAGAG
jgi:hypothetical protein